MIQRITVTLCVTFATVVASPAKAAVPVYNHFQLLARAAPSGAWNMIDGVDIKDQTPQINSSGQVAFKVRAVGSSEGLWFKNNDVGWIVYVGPAGATLSTPSLNDAGRVVYEVNGSGTVDGIHYFEPGTEGVETNGPSGATSWESVSINASGRVGYRSDFAGEAKWVSWYPSFPTWVVHATDTGGDFTELFLPAFNDGSQIAGKLVNSAVAAQCGEIRIIDPDASSTLVAQDGNCNDPTSPYAAFDDWIDLVTLPPASTGHVAFVATMTSGDREAYLAANNWTPATLIASTAWPEISSIRALPVAANNNGLVVVMGVDDLGDQTMAVGDGTALERVVTVGALLPTDLGLAKVTQFEGSANISDSNVIAFNVALSSPDGLQDWGTGVFVATTSVFVDGFEAGNTDAWSAVAP